MCSVALVWLHWVLVFIKDLSAVLIYCLAKSNIGQNGGFLIVVLISSFAGGTSLIPSYPVGSVLILLIGPGCHKYTAE